MQEAQIFTFTSITELKKSPTQLLKDAEDEALEYNEDEQIVILVVSVRKRENGKINTGSECL